VLREELAIGESSLTLLQGERSVIEESAVPEDENDDISGDVDVGES
jgi:hypothetical protein